MPETSPRAFNIHSGDVAVASQRKVRTKVPTRSQDNTLHLSSGRQQLQVTGAPPSRLPPETPQGSDWVVWAAFSDTQSAETGRNKGHRKAHLGTRVGKTVPLASSNSGCLIKQICHPLLNRPRAVHGIAAVVEDGLFLHFGFAVLKWNEISL